MSNTCKVPGCDRPHKGRRGYCEMHYLRWRKHGDPGKAEPIKDYFRPDTCTVPGCDKPHHARGYCAMHYARWRKHGDPGEAEVILLKYPDTCTVPGCDRPHKGRGYCHMHLRRWRKHGDPNYVNQHPETCTIDGCNRAYSARGYCAMHYRRWLKQMVIDYYGGRCECCGETTLEFLSIDHVKGDGAKHRKEIGNATGLYRRLITSNFETKYQLRVLCMNCNIAYGYYGYCPHQTGEQARIPDLSKTSVVS